MHNVWLVAKHEIVTTIGKKSFWFMTLIFPLLIIWRSACSRLCLLRIWRIRPRH